MKTTRKTNTKVSVSPATDRELAAMVTAADLKRKGLLWPAIARRVKVKATRLAELRKAYNSLWCNLAWSAAMKAMLMDRPEQLTLALYDPVNPDAPAHEITGEIPGNRQELVDFAKEYNRLAARKRKLFRLMGVFPVSQVVRCPAKQCST